ncbi:MAG: hypothetical protein IJM50_01065 [Lachnospiraceae bacterium]|nr:hypothetical protein [Lachnospiraceae bacterium]
MERKDIYEGISGISPEFIDEAENHVFIRRRMPAVLKWAAVAAALMLFGGVGVYAATGGFTVRKLMVNGYEVSANITRIPMNEIKGRVNEASGIIREQFRTHEPFDSRMPDTYYKTLENAKEAADYVGYGKLKTPYFPYDQADVTVEVNGDQKGRIKDILIMRDCLNEKIIVQNWTWLFTKHYDRDDFVIEYPDDLASEMTEFMTGSGLQCLVFESDPEIEGRKGLTGYIAVGNAVYMCHTAFDANDRAEAENILHDWAESLN